MKQIFNKETGEFNGELSDIDVYHILKESGMITDDFLTEEEFIIWRQLVEEGKNDEDALLIAKSYTTAKNILDKNTQK